MRTSFWQLSFRPFFFLGALHALLVILLWIGYLTGLISKFGNFDPILWHSHEMIYGFTSAIIVGFVLTAAQNWTGIRGVHGRPLQLLVAVWVLARVLILIPNVSPLLVAVVDLIFYPAAAFLMIPYLKDPDLKTERFFYGFFAILFFGNLLSHLDTMQVLPGYGLRGIFLGLDTIIIVIVFMGGRVIPFFTESSIAKSQPVTRQWVEVGSHVTAVLFLIGDWLAPSSAYFAAISFLACGVHFIRLLGWQVRRVRKIPLIWVLHLGYLWLVIGFFLSGLSAWGWVAKSLAIHAFTVGCLGMIVYGMISRVSLGHTGRRLHPSLSIVVGYVLLCLSALIRVFMPMILSGAYKLELVLSGVLWIMAFLIFLVGYSPMLFSPRVDGRPG
jgi:uncharacterized protein involved in response to NO